MNREEAIVYLTILGGIGGITDNEAMALEIAIEALEQEPNIDELRAEITALQEPILEKINKMKSEIADSLEFWDYSSNNNPLARDMLETITNFWGDIRGEE